MGLDAAGEDVYCHFELHVWKCKKSMQAYLLQNEIVGELFRYINDFDLVIRHFGIIIMAEWNFDTNMI